MSVRFDAAGDRITWSGTGPAPSSGFTATWWAYLSVDRNDFSAMLRLHRSSGATTILNIATDSGGQLPCIFTVGGSSTGPQGLPVAGWARVAVTVNGTASTVYVALDAGGATQSAAGTVGANAALTADSGYTVGGRAPADSSEWYNGRIAHLRLWTSVLTQGEIEAEWASATPVRTTLLFADYPLSGVGDLLDHSGNARHLVAGGTAVTTEDGPPISTTITGTLAAGLPALSLGAAGSVSISASASLSLPALSLGAAGAASLAGEATWGLPALVATLAGTASLDGELAAALLALDAGLAGAVGTGPGTLVAELPSLAAELAGTALMAGEVNATFPALTAAFSGSVSAFGVLTMTLPALTMASSMVAWPPAVEDASAAETVDVTGPLEVPWIAVS